MNSAFRRLLRILHPRGDRGLAAPRVGRIRFGDLRRTSPISLDFGFERGLPIDRYYIERFLDGCSTHIHGRVLEIGDDSYTRRFGGNAVTERDVLHVDPNNERATIAGDLAQGEHIPSGAFDCIILTQTLHLIFDVSAAVATLHRILKPTGTLLLTVPGITQLSNDEWAGTWFWSFTPLAVEWLFGPLFGPSQIRVEAHGNVLASVAFLHGIAAEEVTPEELDRHDPHYPMLITLRAQKASDGAAERPVHEPRPEG